MGTCGSFYSVASSIWDEWGPVVQQAAALTVSTATGEMVPYPVIMASAKLQREIKKKMISFWNKQANNTWATIGPRRLDLNTKHEGKLIGTSGRLFITLHPLIEDKITVHVTKRDGKAKTSVTVCKIGKNKKGVKVWDFKFASGKDNIGKQLKKTLTGVQGYLLSIHLDAKSVANTFSYSLRAQKVKEEKKTSTKANLKDDSKTKGSKKAVVKKGQDSTKKRGKTKKRGAMQKTAAKKSTAKRAPARRRPKRAGTAKRKAAGRTKAVRRR
jgi:hypothetical protein